MSTFPDSTPLFAAPKLADKIVQNIRVDFKDNLSWLTRHFPIATVGVGREEAKGLYPQVDANDGTKTHFDIRPDGTINAYIFFELDGMSPDYEEDETEYSLSLITWGQLDKIDVSKAYDFSMELIQEQLVRLRQFDIEDVEVITNPEDVFDKYPGLTQEKNQFLMRPFVAWKLEFEVTDVGCF